MNSILFIFGSITILFFFVCSLKNKNQKIFLRHLREREHYMDGVFDFVFFWNL